MSLQIETKNRGASRRDGCESPRRSARQRRLQPDTTDIPIIEVFEARSEKVSSVTGREDVRTRPWYIVEVEINCEECGGSGFDPGGVDPWGPEVCPRCHGGKKQTITRNYLAEAFQIAANPESIRQIEREHLAAVIHHCRETVRALMSLPEVA